MPSHKVTLTDKGFKSLSSDFIIDCLAGFILFSVVMSHTIRHTNNLVLFGFFMLIAIGVYIFYRTKNGYLYPIGYFYQVLLFWAITPSLFINWYSISIIGIILFGIHYKNNPFQSTYFPLSIYLTLLISTSIFVFGQSYMYKELLDTSTNSSYFFIDHSSITGYFFKLNTSPNGSFNPNGYSILEKLGYYSPLLMATLSFRQKNVLLDFILVVGIFGLSLLYFGENLDFLKERTVVIVSLWYLAFAAPGRNKGFSLYYSFISLVFTGLFSLLFIKESMGFPPIMIPISFFIFQSIIYILTQDISIITIIKRSLSK